MSGTPWQVVFYEDHRGRCPVEDFMNGLTRKEQAYIAQRIAMLERLGLDLMGDHLRQIDGKLWEYRLRLQRRAFRIFYFVPERGTFVFLHAIVKASDRTPRHEIDVAEGRLHDYLSHFETDNH